MESAYSIAPADWTRDKWVHTFPKGNIMYASKWLQTNKKMQCNIENIVMITIKHLHKNLISALDNP